MLIIGAGPAGLSAARILSSSGYEVEIFEEADSVGGMSKSFKLFDQIVDIGPHRFFSKDARLNDFWLSHTNKHKLPIYPRDEFRDLYLLAEMAASNTTTKTIASSWDSHARIKS